MSGQHFRKTDEAGIERILGDIVGDTAIVLARRFDESAQVRHHAGDAVGRKAKCAENDDGHGVRLAGLS